MYVPELCLADDRSYLFCLPLLLLFLLFVRLNNVWADDRARCFWIRRRMAIQSIPCGPYYQDCHCTSSALDVSLAELMTGGQIILWRSYGTCHSAH
jgi:hypothetical protein